MIAREDIRIDEGMADLRSFSEELVEVGDEVVLSVFESHHLVKVHRAREGAVVRLFDGNGLEANGELVEASTRGAKLRVSEREQKPEPTRKIVLLQAIPKGKTFESEIRRLTELGVWEIVPIRTARTEFSIQEEQSKGREERWRAAAIEGAKQSGNPWLPKIFPVMSWTELMQAVPSWKGELVIASLAEGAISPTQWFAESRLKNDELSSVVHLLVGPEGDFSPEEIADALSVGFHPVTLGPYVLRVETAALALTVVASNW